ncbi:MAG: ribose 5-phosphate isomerase B [Defluviitaleaceae bacterium]|nr:ribose 5-phosphate isomerase B [Defluviitaleaceae bacterium]MCL2264236.1 ribose 5-phosphate isomerase B [Defluviitaleaceae bacterium]
MRIAISNDHAATDLKKILAAHIAEKFSAEVTDIGSQGEAVDYPKYAQSAAKAILAGEHDLAILLCGTGAGMCIAANKVSGIRAVVCSEPYTARLSREHNNAQILCIGARVVGTELAKAIVDAFLTAKFEGGRHQTRVDMME